jgi:hypothetical protein
MRKVVLAEGTPVTDSEGLVGKPLQIKGKGIDLRLLRQDGNVGPEESEDPPRSI